MSLAALAQRLTESKFDGRYSQVAEGLTLARATAPYDFEAMVYQPLICLILQGAKETTVAGRSAVVGEGQLILVSHDLPVVARVTVASPERPYLAVVSRLDLAELRSLDPLLTHDDGPAQARSFEVGAADEALLSVFERYAALADDPEEARVLQPLIRRELHYRLLKGERGGMLRQLLARNSHASQIARAIEELRSRFHERIEMDALARTAGMSPSAFYRHFKRVTDTTPLQYQKDLRLTEAQRLLRSDAHSVSSAAYAVGYESPSQFSREYSRKFSVPPKEELQRRGNGARSSRAPA